MCCARSATYELPKNTQKSGGGFINLNKGMKELIIDRFKTGASIAEIAAWYGKKPEQIEKVIRDDMNDQAEAERMTRESQLSLVGKMS